jgi:hypothetical protein
MLCLGAPGFGRALCFSGRLLRLGDSSYRQTAGSHNHTLHDPDHSRTARSVEPPHARSFLARDTTKKAGCFISIPRMESSSQPSRWSLRMPDRQNQSSPRLEAEAEARLADLSGSRSTDSQQVAWSATYLHVLRGDQRHPKRSRRIDI